MSGDMDLGQEVVVEVESRDSLVTDQSSRSSRKRAKVWEFVDTEVVDGKEKAICRYCKFQLSSEPGKGTTHLNRHIAIHCHSIPQEDRDRFIATLKPKSLNEEKSVLDPEVFHVLIAKYFISGEIAFRKAHDPHWTNLINYCQPSFRVVGRQSVRTNCVLFYEEEKLQLMDKFRKVKSHVSLTANLWSSNQNLGYLGVTAHLIDAEFELHKKIIAFKKISFPHTSYAVQDGITSCLMEWELTEQLFTLTLDNANVNNKAVKDIRDALGVGMFFKGEHLHVKCAVHVLNIMVQAGVKVISNAIGRVRDIVKVITSTPSRMQIFNTIVQNLGLKAKSGLILDVPHRWNATYDMLHDALKYKVALNRYAVEQHHQVPSQDEWAKVKALHGFLQQFSEATKAFFADRHPTAHLFLKMLLAIRDVLLEEVWNSNELLNEIANAMHAKFEKHWTKPDLALLIAVVLDPSMKTDFIKFYFYTVGENVKVKMRELNRYLNKYYLEYEKIVRSNNVLVFDISNDEQSTNESGESGSTSLRQVSGKRRIELAFTQFASQSSQARQER
ncbi:zinc finger BED domain-containing protein RICESLEEPER 2 [Setaria italica]|uniref:zinc finger BED domain-containing protein RICESLEEPER 2 n=1 Tax=Setaria italica TaxID=4555 RepID=UPI0006459A7E|nr:zinc finger BED domain-containing protein RICESLEEPER 2 [Setaria italica]